METPIEAFDIPLEVAEVYEAEFVPAIFAEWAPVILDAVGLTGPVAGGRLLDVACGTGIVARTAREICGSDLAVTGVDLNPAMLAVAGRIAPEIEWWRGDVSELPLADGHVDAAVCQMAAMFFPDRRRAVAEMARVVRPGGRLALVVPASLAEQPAYGPFVDIAVAATDDRARLLLSTYWVCGDREVMADDLAAAGLESVSSRTRVGTARFESVAGFVDTEIDATPLTEWVGAEARARITEEVAARLAGHVRPGQPFEIPLVANVVSARVPER